MVVSDETAVTELMSLQTQAFFPNTGKNTGPQRSATVTSSPPVSTYLTVAFSKKKKKKKKVGKPQHNPEGFLCDKLPRYSSRVTLL
jgi:hypothetical protein